LHGYKAQTWEGGIRVPFIVKWAAHLPAGKVDDRPVIQLDILPTVLAAAGVDVKPEWKLDGVNLLPYLSGAKKGQPHDLLYWRFGGQIAIRKGDWKLVKATGLSTGPEALSGKATTEGAELYNLAQDIGEKNNLAAKEPEKVKELAAAWNAWNAELVEPAWRPGGQQRKNNLASSETPTSNASPTGPWKTGDALSAETAPKIAGKSLVVSAEIEPEGTNGVIVVQGGAGNGYALYLRDGKLTFGVRIRRELTTVTADKPLGKGRFKVTAELTGDKEIKLSVDGKPVATGHAPDLIARQPARGLTVGSDGDSPVGDYNGPNAFSGKIENVTLRSL
jgi:hypothetical protein